MYLCNSCYVDFNFAFQTSQYLASVLSIPLVIIMVRPSEEFTYPFSNHTLHVLSHLSLFHKELVKLSVTPLLLFSSSLSNTVSNIVKEMHPIFFIMDHFSDLRFASEMAQLIANDVSIRQVLIEVSNVVPITTSLPLSSVFPPPAVFNTLTSTVIQSIQSMNVSQKHSSVSLDPSIQLRVAYSLVNEESFFSRSESTLLSDFSDCVLILPPFLTAVSTHSLSPINPSDFTYGTEKRVLNTVANWGDIHHEILYSTNSYDKDTSIHDSIQCSKWYYPFVKNSIPNSTVYKLSWRIYSGFLSEYSVWEECYHNSGQICELCQIVTVKYCYQQFLAINQSTQNIILSMLDVIALTDPVYYLGPVQQNILSTLINERIRHNGGLYPIDNLLQTLLSIVSVEGVDIVSINKF